MSLNSIKNDNDLIDTVFDKDGCIIYGTGRVGTLILRSLQHLSYDYAFHKEMIFAVSNENHLVPSKWGYPVKTIAEAIAQHPDYVVIVAVLSPDQQQEMIAAYQSAGGKGNPVTVNVKYVANHQTLETLEERIQRLERKLSMIDDVWPIDDIKFYVPNYPYENLQRHIVDRREFYEENILEQLDRYLDNHSVIFDIGANIGNHSLYWAKRTHAQKIYAFEPVLSTYKILEKNIAINRLEDIVMPFNIGLSEQDGYANILTYGMEGIGSTQLQQSKDGEMVVQRLDSLPLTDELERVDFVKIDVEGFECRVLRGGRKFFQKFKPIVFIESFPDKFNETDSILKDYGYEHKRQFDEINHLYQHPSRT